MHRQAIVSASSVVVLAALTGNALAQTPAATPPPLEHTLTANVGLYSEYIFRGISQTGGKPAVQGGFDYAHSSGFYAGTWASNISWLEDFGAYSRSSLEWDFYAGYKANFGDTEFFYDVGGLYYYYPGKRLAGIVNASTFEIYGAVGWKWVSLKLSYATTDYFGARPSRNADKTDGSIYFDLSAAYPIGDTGLSVIGHVGHLDLRRDGSEGGATTLGKVGYTDWKAGVAYTVTEGWVKGLEVGAYYSGNSAKSRFYTDLSGYDTSTDRGVVYVKKTL